MDTIKLNITQLNTIIKRIIDAEDFLQTISVYGEVSNFKISNGIAYFDIKEDGAQLACIKFGAAELDIANGDMVLLTGRLNYYVKSGRLNFIANNVQPYGLGALYKQYLALKEKLTAEGLFDERYKKQLPRFASKIGVVTSATGAVIRDIIHVATKKNPYSDIIVYPARVQGAGAEREIIAGLNYFETTDVDVIIIARGGGSFEDLAPFNTEVLARAIFACKKPIISAVGHETDFSISDFVSDVRAPTPSVAAELAFFDYAATKQNILEYVELICKSSLQLCNNGKQTVADCMQSILINATKKQEYLNLALSVCTQNIQGQLAKILADKNAKYNLIVQQIDKINPLNLLKKGYAIVYVGDKKVTKTQDAQVGDAVKILVSNGSLTAKITNKENTKQ